MMGRKLDTITVACVAVGLKTIAREMTIVVDRTARSPRCGTRASILIFAG